MPKYRYRQIAAAPFCRFFDILPERTMRFAHVRINDKGVMLLDITTAVPISIASRGVRSPTMRKGTDG